MLKEYVVRRLLMAIPVVLGMTIIVFLAIKMIPGDPILYFYAGPGSQTMDSETYKMLRHKFGLDLPLHEQYFNYLSNLISGNLGHSLRYGRPVGELIAGRYPATITLAIVGTLVSVAIGMAVGILSAVRQYSKADYASMTVALFGVSVPSFWLGIMLMLMFGVFLRILPVSGSGGVEHLILPSLTLAIPSAAYYTRLTRSSMLDVINADYIRTARSKGLKERMVILKHALRNALIPIITYVGTQIGYLLGGALVVETVFAWPGVGLLLWNAILSRDLPLIEGCVLVMAITFSLINIVVDITYGFLDPRIRYR